MTTPMRSRTSQLLEDGGGDGVMEGRDTNDDDDDDEETLQLKLAALEARLRLKRLQRNRGTGSDDGNTPRTTQSPKRRQHDQQQRNDEVQVPASPLRRPASSLSKPRSPPRRILYGIDKGLKADQVSLKRPPLSRPRTAASPSSSYRRPESTKPRAPSASSGRTPSLPRIKSFSERIAESRSVEKTHLERAERAEKVRRSRSSAFQYDRAELESLRAAAAEESKKNPQSSSPSSKNGPARSTESFSRQDILRSCHLDSSKSTKQMTPSAAERRINSGSGAQNQKDDNLKSPDSSKFEGYSSLHLSNRILPHSFLTRTLTGKKILQIPDLLRMVKAPDFELPDSIDVDYVVFGIVASKSSPREVRNAKNRPAAQSDDGLQNTDKYMAITLTDLKWSIDLFLFDTALPRYYKLSEGIVIAILNPTIMPPPKHKLDTNRFSLSISSSDDKILEVGSSRDIGFCKAVRKDGKTCRSWLDARKTEFCEFHIDIQVRHTQSQRMGVNNGTTMFGPGGRSAPRTGLFGGDNSGRKRPPASGNGKSDRGAQYDRWTQSTYYVAPAPSRNQFAAGRTPHMHGRSAASLIDADDDDGSPFVPAGMNGRGMENKEERFRRRLADQQRERDIMQKIVTSSSRGAGPTAGRDNVGAEYLRSRVGLSDDSGDGSPAEKKKAQSQHTAALGNLRNAASIQLAPAKRSARDHDEGERPPSSVSKKTRFVTANGIREAGRESIGLGMQAMHSGNDRDDDDDDLLVV